VTRRAVEARIVLETDAKGRAKPKPAPQPVVMEDAAWTPVMKGMMGVAMPGGTGANLDSAKPAASSGVVRIFAKTGTPTVEQYGGPTTANRALQAFIDRGCPLPFNSTTSKIEAPKDLARSPCLRGADPHALAAEIARINRSLTPRSVPANMVAGGRVIRVPITRQETTLFAHAVALVVARYRDEKDPWDQPVRALTIVVNIQKRPDTSRLPALDVARQLLTDPAIRDWLASDPAGPAVKRAG
jgi:hypothetical protein